MHAVLDVIVHNRWKRFLPRTGKWILVSGIGFAGSRPPNFRIPKTWEVASCCLLDLSVLPGASTSSTTRTGMISSGSAETDGTPSESSRRSGGSADSMSCNLQPSELFFILIPKRFSPYHLTQQQSKKCHLAHQHTCHYCWLHNAPSILST